MGTRLSFNFRTNLRLRCMCCQWRSWTSKWRRGDSPPLRFATTRTGSRRWAFQVRTRRRPTCRGAAYTGRGSEDESCVALVAEPRVPRHDHIAPDGDAQSRDAQEAAEGQLIRQVLLAEDDLSHTQHGTHQRTDDHRCQRAAEAKEGSDHGHHLDVSQAHPLAVAHLLVGPSDKPRHPRADSRGESGVGQTNPRQAENLPEEKLEDAGLRVHEWREGETNQG